MGDVRPTCCEKASKTDAVTWRWSWQWRQEEEDRDPWWGSVVSFLSSPSFPSHPVPLYGRVDFCPFCGGRLVAPSATTGDVT